MQFVIQAEDGDLIIVDNSEIAFEQELVHVQLGNSLFEEGEIDRFSLSIDQARQLARALLAASRPISDDQAVDRELSRMEAAVSWNALIAQPMPAS